MSKAKKSGLYLSAILGRKAEIAAETRALDAEIAALEDKIRPLESARGKAWEKRRALAAEASEIELREGMDWKQLLRPQRDFPSMEQYHEFSRRLESEFGMSHSGRWSSTEQPVAKICIELDKAGSVERNRKGVRELAPLLLPIEDGMAGFGIFEHTLSEGGIYQLLVAPDLSRARLTFTRYRRTSVEIEGDFETVFARIVERHWYSKSGCGDRSDDDEDEC